MNRAKPLIKVREAQCRLGRKQLLQVSHLDFCPGERWCVFGGNGAGKSTLANLIAGRRRETASYVSYKEGFSPERDIHIVSFEEQQRLWQQDNRLDMSEFSDDAHDLGTTVAALIQSSRSRTNSNLPLFEQLVSALELQPLLDQGIRFLSSGQVRKALIARALYAARDTVPQVIILDDPLETVDKQSRQTIVQCIESHQTDQNCIIQLCRRQQDIFPSCDQLALMDNLMLVAQGTRDELETRNGFHDLLAGSTKTVGETIGTIPAGNKVSDPGPLIELIDVDAGYGELGILRKFTWKMRPGEHVLIEGPNGCGKSTLLSLIDGDNHKAYGQQVYLFGVRRGSGETVWEVKAHFGVVSNELHNKYTKGWRLLDVVVSGFYDSVGLYDDSGALETGMARQWLGIVGLASKEKDYYHELSFGEQRLVLLARAMVKSPRILVLDEPCVGLDDYHRRQILKLLDGIAERTGTQLIYVSHVPDERPECLNCRLSFVPGPDGSYLIEQGSIHP